MKSELGFTVIEFSIVSAILFAVMGLVGGLLISGVKTARIAEQETASLNDMRIAQGRLLKDIRSAVAADTTTNSACTSAGAPVGYCLLLYYESPANPGVVDQIRYRAVQTTGGATLYRDSACDPMFTCTTNSALITNLATNSTYAAQTPAVVPFSCDTTLSYPQIKITLIATPLSQEAATGTLKLIAQARPRDIKGTQC